MIKNKKSIAANQVAPGMILNIEDKLFQIDACSKTSLPRGGSFMKLKLKNLSNGKLVDKNFKLNQSIEEVQLEPRRLEFLYLEGKKYLFLDIDELEQILIASNIVEEKSHFLKEAVEVTGYFYGDKVYSIQLPQFLELMVVDLNNAGKEKSNEIGAGTRIAVLETGAKIEVPPFIENGDIIKVDTRTKEYIQRV